MSLLTVIQKSCRLLSLPVPSEVATSQDAIVQQLFEIANEEGNELASSFDWQIMRKQYLFTTIAQPEQSDPVPQDFDRFIANSFFNRTTRRNVIGPITPQQWQSIQAQPQLNRVFLAFIQRNGRFLITPTPPANEEIAYEYITKDWCYNASTLEGQSDYVLDSDTSYLDEKLIVLGVRWRFLKSKGLDYAEDFRTYQTQVTQKQARDGGNTEISSTGDSGYILSPNLPVGSFPGP